MQLMPIDVMTKRVQESGFHPAWLQEMEGTWPSQYTIHPAPEDNSTTHNDPFKILSFYLPHIAPFNNLNEVILMEDDVIIQGDVARAWDFKLVGDAVMSASCHNWVWSDCDQFESSTALSYLDVPYLGFGRVGTNRHASDARCANGYDQECIPEGFLELLATESRKINGDRHANSRQP
jgi:hypothetical protein